MKSCLPHECKKTDGLKGNSLTACIRTCDYKQIEIPAEIYINRYNLLRVDERVSALLYVNVAVGVHNRLASVAAFG